MAIYSMQISCFIVHTADCTAMQGFYLHIMIQFGKVIVLQAYTICVRITTMGDDSYNLHSVLKKKKTFYYKHSREIHKEQW